MSQDLDTTIQSAASGPRSAAAGQVSAEQHPLADLIEADQYLQARQARGKVGGGIILQRMNPGSGPGDGACDD